VPTVTYEQRMGSKDDGTQEGEPAFGERF